LTVGTYFRASIIVVGASIGRAFKLALKVAPIARYAIAIVARFARIDPSVPAEARSSFE
jgi:hypothetical protein